MVERRNAELLNIRRGENILTRAEEVVNDLCKVWVFSHICWAASEQWEEEVQWEKVVEEKEMKEEKEVKEEKERKLTVRIARTTRRD